MRLVLASASPRRADLLAAAGFEFDTHPVEIDERPMPGEAPEAYVRRLAVAKSAAAAVGLANGHSRVILAADTAVVFDHQILGKPRDAAERRSMLRRLSGCRHEVLTGISLRSGEQELGAVERSAVFFGPLGTDEIEWYVGTGEGSDKAGGYAVQGLASRFVRRVEGSYSNVVGLPIAVVYELLKQLIQTRDGGSRDVLFWAGNVSRKSL
jgi:septum formation protein